MKHDIHQSQYKPRRNKKLNKLIYHDNSNSNNKSYSQKINYFVKKVNEITTYIDIDLNKGKQNSVIRRKEFEKSQVYLKNTFKTFKNSFNNNTNSEENLNLYNQFKETKENISLNRINKGYLTTKSKKLNTTNSKELHKTNIYHNNSCLKKSNLKRNRNYNKEFPNRRNLIQVLNMVNKSKIVLKKLSNSNYKNINLNTNINNEIKSNKKIKSHGLLPIENNNNSLMKKINSNNYHKNYSNTDNNDHNCYWQNNNISNNNNIIKNNFNIKPSKIINNFNEENIFNYNEERQVELTKEEKAFYGDRIMKGYFKIKLLGKGGYGAVWLCQNSLNHKECAVKQTSKKKNQENSHNLNNILSNARNEINILNLLNNRTIYNNNEEIKNSENDLDMNNVNNNDKIYCEIIPKIYDTYEDNNDIWFSFEKGGSSLSNLCFKIKGEFEKGERIYLIQKGQFLVSLFSNINQFKYLLKQLTIGINYINNKGVIHSDIKPENILIEYNHNIDEFHINSVKIVDYGSSFLYNEISTSTNSNTPEYSCPEITIGNKKFAKELTNSNKYINAVDVWSLGITFLEMCLCCPIWMNFKSKIIINGKIIYSHGIFGCRMRDSNKIYNKQIEVRKNLNKLLKNSLLYMFEKQDRDNFVDLLGKMLNIDYTKRINTEEILNHPFLDEKD